MFTALLILVAIIPFDAIHHHELDYCHSIENQNEHACHIRIITPNTNDSHACSHPNHIEETKDLCNICNFEFTKDLVQEGLFKYTTFETSNMIKIFCRTLKCSSKIVISKGRSPPIIA